MDSNFRGTTSRGESRNHQLEACAKSSRQRKGKISIICRNLINFQREAVAKRWLFQKSLFPRVQSKSSSNPVPLPVFPQTFYQLRLPTSLYFPMFLREMSPDLSAHLLFMLLLRTFNSVKEQKKVFDFNWFIYQIMFLWNTY